MESKNSTFDKIPKTVLTLGMVSMLMDTSSEMIHSLLPLFMTMALGMGALAVGVTEGAAQAVALIVKVFSGMLSDYLGKRKALAVTGYALAAVTKPLFALASGMTLIFSARIIDRIGKGIRGAPRDALIADVTPPEIRGAAFGLRQALDTAGAFAGPLLGALFMVLLANNFRAVFWIASIPAVIAVFLLVSKVKEPEQKNIKLSGNPVSAANLKKMSSSYWMIVAVGGLFGLARFSEAFLVLRAKDLGVPLAAVPLVMVFMNIVYAAAAYPFGKFSDKIGRGSLLMLGLFVLFFSNIALAKAS
ncbi:MAG: MFS transporter, partial [Endomicrobia bacterium]|nr:MFS transporter [Endomicrobiia bacterium]